MGSLPKMKQVIAACAVSGSPNRSPSTSPAVHLRRRRRKTLRMLLDHSEDRRQLRPNPPDQSEAAKGNEDPRERAGGLGSRRKLKDLLVSSPPLAEGAGPGNGGGEVGVRLVMTETASSESGFVIRRRYGGSLRRPALGPLRYRLLRRAWRPALVPIPE